MTEQLFPYKDNPENLIIFIGGHGKTNKISENMLGHNPAGAAKGPSIGVISFRPLYIAGSFSTCVPI